MNLNEFAKEIHANACDKGFWDEPRPFDELCALMISELAEALEEARAGRPMEWYKRMPDCHPNCADERIDECEEAGGCYFGFGALKPEGIAVEMADCAIRLLDFIGHEEVAIELKPVPECKDLCTVFMDAANFICHASGWEKHDKEMRDADLVHALAIVLGWFKANDLDFETIARRKHEFNKTRAYKHDKLF